MTNFRFCVEYITHLFFFILFFFFQCLFNQSIKLIQLVFSIFHVIPAFEMLVWEACCYYLWIHKALQ